MNRSEQHQRIREVYIRERNYLNNGLNQLGWIRQFAELYLLTVAVFAFQQKETPHHLLIPLFILLIIAFRMIGWLWDKAHLYDEENEFSNKRNPAIRTLLERFK